MGRDGAAWGVTPAIARVQAYLMARQEPLTEREVREALGLSHRAASLALAEAESWGIVERVPEPRRVGRRGPAGTAYLAVGDHWQWFGRVIAERKLREGDPIVAVLEEKAAEAAAARAASGRYRARRAARLARVVPRLRPVVRSRGWSVPQLEPRELERSLNLLGRVPDATILRLFDLLGGLDDDDSSTWSRRCRGCPRRPHAAPRSSCRGSSDRRSLGPWAPRVWNAERANGRPRAGMALAGL